MRARHPTAHHRWGGGCGSGAAGIWSTFPGVRSGSAVQCCSTMPAQQPMHILSRHFNPLHTLPQPLQTSAGLPAEVLSTPFGQMIAPMLSGLEEQMRSMRAQAYRPHIEAAAAAALAGAPAATTFGAAAGAAPAVEVAAPAVGAAAAEPVAEPAVPAAGAAGGAAGAAGAAEEKEDSGLRSAEVEIEAAVAAGMIQEAEQALSSLELQAGAGQQPEAAAAAAVAPPAREPAAPDAAAAAPAPPTAATGDKLAAERAVEAEFKRLVATGMAEHEAQALALEAVAAAAGAVTDNPVQHGLGKGGVA